MGVGAFSLLLGEPANGSSLRQLKNMLNTRRRQRRYKTMSVITSPYPSPLGEGKQNAYF